MPTIGFSCLRFVFVFLCFFSACAVNAEESEDWDDNCWEFGPGDYLDDEDDEDDEEECRCLWSKEDREKAAEYDKIVEEIEQAEIESDLYPQPRGLGKWFAKKVKKMFMKFVGLKKVKNLDELAYQLVRFNRKVGKFVKVPGIKQMVENLSKTDLTPEMLDTISERLKYYKKHKHAKPQNNKNSRAEEFKMNAKIVWGSMECIIGYAMTPFPGLNVAGLILIGHGIGNISDGVKEYAYEYMEYLEEQKKHGAHSVLYIFDFKSDDATEDIG